MSRRPPGKKSSARPAGSVRPAALPRNFMSYKNDSNYVSTWSWFWMMFVTAIPVIGWIMIFVWAFTGDNESRKNYYRAILLWLLLSVLLAAGFILVCLALGTGPVILKNINIHL